MRGDYKDADGNRFREVKSIRGGGKRATRWVKVTREGEARPKLDHEDQDNSEENREKETQLLRQQGHTPRQLRAPGQDMARVQGQEHRVQLLCQQGHPTRTRPKQNKGEEETTNENNDAKEERESNQDNQAETSREQKTKTRGNDLGTGVKDR